MAASDLVEEAARQYPAHGSGRGHGGVGVPVAFDLAEEAARGGGVTEEERSRGTEHSKGGRSIWLSWQDWMHGSFIIYIVTVNFIAE